MSILKRYFASASDTANALGFAAVLGLGTLAAATPAHAVCRQALALGLDISGSVDGDEYRLQLDGLAGAMLHPDVILAFLAIPTVNVRVFVYEWGGQRGQTVLVQWTEIASLQDLQSVANTLRAHRRIPVRLPTALGDAMLFGANALSSQTDCWRRTLDLSGDGRSNVGPTPREAGADDTLDGVTINALVIGNEALQHVERYAAALEKLGLYFQAEVIRGPDAFVQPALNFAGFEEAMTKKLLRELGTRAVGALVSQDR